MTPFSHSSLGATAAASAPSLSIIIVSWNAREHLRSCLMSIREARPVGVMEIIVVDNASADGSPEMVAQSFPEATLICTGANLGFAKANNLAMQQAKGSLFALVNSDALVHPGCLETLSAYLVAQPEVGLVGPRVLGWDGNLQRTCRKLPTLWNTLCRALALDRMLTQSRAFGGYEVPPADHDHLHDAEVLSGCFCVARADAVRQVGGFDDAFFFYGEDIDWCKRFVDSNWRISFIPQATATHFGGGSTAKAPLRFSIEILRATLRYWRKHHGEASARACLWLLVLHHGLRLVIRSFKRIAGLGSSAESRGKWDEDVACLKWLLFRVELPTASRSSIAVS